MELLRCRMDLVGQVIGPATGNRGLDQFARPHPDAGPSALAGPLLVIKHEGEALLACPSQQRPGIGERVADRDVDRIDAVPLQDIRHLGGEVVEPVDRHEIFLQHISALCPRDRLKFGDVVAGLEIAPMDLAAEEKQWVEQVLAPLLAERPFGDRPHHIFLDRPLPARRLQPLGVRRRALGPLPSRRAQRTVMWRVQVCVVEQRGARVAHRLLEERQVRRRRELRRDALEPLVVGNFELGLNDDAKRPVAPDRTIKDLAVLGRRRVMKRAVGGDEPDRPNAHDQRAEPDVAAVAIDAERPAHGEIGISLHDLDRQIVRIEEALQVTPARAREHAHRARHRIETRYSGQAAHVDVQAAVAGGLAAHAEMAAADRHRAVGAAQGVLDLGDGLRPGYRPDRDRVEAGDVVDRDRGRGHEAAGTTR